MPAPRSKDTEPATPPVKSTKREWQYPDTSGVQLSAEIRKRIAEEAMHALQTRYPPEGPHGPRGMQSSKWVHENKRDELATETAARENAWRRRLIWKDPSQEPDEYVPPTTSADLQARLLNAESFFARSRFINEDLSGFPKGGQFNFADSYFEGCQFHYSDFDGASFQRCIFRRCSGFESMSAARADFSGAQFKEGAVFAPTTEIEGAAFDEADLRQVTGLVFNENSIYRTRFPTESHIDIWSRLRRKYNGFALFLSSLLLIVFLVPFVSKLTALIAYDGLIASEQRKVEWLRERVSPSAFQGIEQIISAQGVKLNECALASSNCERKYAIVAALTEGGGNWLLHSAAILAAVGFVLRYFLTTKVAQLREHENRTACTPGWLEYQSLAAADKVLTTIRYPLGAYYLFVFARLAFTKIYVA